MGGKGSGRKKMTDDEMFHELMDKQREINQNLVDLTYLVAKYNKKLAYFMATRGK